VEQTSRSGGQTLLPSTQGGRRAGGRSLMPCTGRTRLEQLGAFQTHGTLPTQHNRLVPAS
jgi:hypothetical protein